MESSRKMFRKSVWIPILIVLLAVIGCGLFYGKRLAQEDSVKVHKPVEVEQRRTPKPPPPGETAESGHWHGDEWHAEPHSETPEVSAGEAEPHTPQNTSEDTAEVQGGPVGAQQVDAQTSTQGTPESSQRTPESREAYNKWVAWEDKHSELRKEYGQASQEMLDAMPGTEEDAKRYIADENYKREVQRKMQEAMDKSAEILGRMREHEAKRIFPPGTPTQ